MTLILLRNTLGSSQVSMIRAILRDSPENRAVLLCSRASWPDADNGQVLSVEPEGAFPLVSWSEVYAMISHASRLLIPATP